MLPVADNDYLQMRFPDFTVTQEAGMVCVMLPGFILPTGFSQPKADLLLRLSPGYPDVPPDMWWFSPAVMRADGIKIQATESQENYLGKIWQRWSRHLNPGQWRSGIDTLQSYVAVVQNELLLAAKIAA